MRKALRQWAALTAAVAGVVGSNAGALAAQARWDGAAPVGNPGDNVTWGDPNNWTIVGPPESPDTPPANAAPADDLIFGNGAAGAVIDLGANRFSNSLSFTRDYTLGGAFTLNNIGGAISVDAGVTGTINAALVNTANGLTKTGAGTLVLGGANTFVGPVNINGGVLTFGGTTSTRTGAIPATDVANKLGAVGNAVNLNGGTLRYTAALRFPFDADANNAHNFTIGAGGGTFDVVAGGQFEIRNAANSLTSGAGAVLTKNGPGNMRVSSGNANFLGTTVLNAGVLESGAANSFGTGMVTVNGGNFAGNANVANPFTLNGGAISPVNGARTFSGAVTLTDGTGGTVFLNDFYQDTARNLTLSGVVSGGGPLNVNVSRTTASRNGTLTLTGANTYTGQTNVLGGTLRGASGVNLPAASNLNLNGGSFETTANFTRALGTGPDQVQLPGGTSGFSAFGAPATVNLGGAGETLVWGTTPHFNPSSLQLGSPAANASVTLVNPIDLNGATRSFTGNAPNAFPGIVGGAVTSSGAAADITINGPAGGNGVVRFTNPGNTGITSVTLNGGELSYETDANIGGPNTPIVFNGGGLQILGMRQNFGSHPITFNAGRNIQLDINDAANTFTLPASLPLVAGQSLTKVGAGTLLLEGTSNTVTTLNMNGGTLDIGSGTLNLSNAGGATLRGTANSTINATGGGSLVISTAAGNNFGDNSVSNGVTLTINAKVSASAANGGFELCCDDPGGTIVLNNPANDFQGNVIMNRAGTLSVPAIGNQNAPSPLGLGNTVVLAAGGNNAATGARLQYTGPGETTNRIISLGNIQNILDASGSGRVIFTSNIAVTSTAAKTLTLTGTGEGEVAGVIPSNTAATAVSKTGTGTWILSGDNTYTGTTTVNAGGVLRITHGAALGTTGAIATNGPHTNIVGNTGGTGRLELTGGITVGESIQIEARQQGSQNTPALSNFSGNNTITAQITGVTGGSTYNIESQSGTLTLAGGFTLGSTATGVGRVLQLMGSGSGIVSGVISNGGGTLQVNKFGAGVWSLTGAATNSGTWTVSEGSLLANNATGSATGTGPVNVGGAGILGGSGSIAGAVTVNPGGTINPGNSPGTLSIAGPVSSGTTGAGLAPTFLTELLAAVSPAAGTDNDVLALTGAAAAGVLDLNNPDRLNLVALNAIPEQATYTIATFASMTGMFDTVLVNGQPSQSTDPAAPNYVTVAYNPTNIQVTVDNLPAVPEPASAGLLAVGALGLLARRRRRA